jgi:putative restriction endonuclease
MTREKSKQDTLIDELLEWVSDPEDILGKNEVILSKTEITLCIEKFDSRSSRSDMIKYSEDEARRAYITSLVRQRLHQRGFRERVLAAYKNQCALCRLRHRELLDAAHIIPDTEPDGDPVVKNGIALCKLHHAAVDKFFIGIRPDGVIIVRKDVLMESDGPMLRHGLQSLHNTRILIPRKTELCPSPDLLERRWERFKHVA